MVIHGETYGSLEERESGWSWKRKGEGVDILMIGSWNDSTLLFTLSLESVNSSGGAAFSCFFVNM